MLDGFWLANTETTVDICVFVFGDVYIRRFVNSAIVTQELAEDLPKQVIVKLTSKKVLLLVNVHRIPRDPVDIDKILQEYPFYAEKSFILDPKFDGDPSSHVYRSLCTFLGYCRPPAEVRALLTPYCKGCWKYDLSNRFACVPSPCKNPHHVLCPACALNTAITKCPYPDCILGNIPFSILNNNDNSDSDSE